MRKIKQCVICQQLHRIGIFVPVQAHAQLFSVLFYARAASPVTAFCHEQVQHTPRLLRTSGIVTKQGLRLFDGTVPVVLHQRVTHAEILNASFTVYHLIVICLLLFFPHAIKFLCFLHTSFAQKLVEFLLKIVRFAIVVALHGTPVLFFHFSPLLHRQLRQRFKHFQRHIQHTQITFNAVLCRHHPAICKISFKNLYIFCNHRQRFRLIAMKKLFESEVAAVGKPPAQIIQFI